MNPTLDSSGPASLRIPRLRTSCSRRGAALIYGRDAGWYVLPVKKGEKNPGSLFRGKDWREFSTRDEATIKAWWPSNKTSHGIALHAGKSGAVVFDVDTPEKLPPWL